MRYGIWILTTALMCVCIGCGGGDETRTAEDVNYWEKRKGQCEVVLTTPASYPIDQVSNCMKVWESYRKVSDLSVDVRSMYAVAFSLVWYQAQTDYDRLVAEAALQRLCVPRHPMGNDGKIQERVPDGLQCGVVATAEMDPNGQQGGGGGETMASTDSSNPYLASRGTVKVKSVSDRTLKKAKGLNKKGFRHHKKKRYGRAAEQYEKALKKHPNFVLAQYNYICALALLQDKEAAIAELETLYTWNDSEVNSKLVQATRDEDLISLRDDPRFRQLTGYFQMTLANGAGEFGLGNVARVQEDLQARNYSINKTVNDKKPRLNPIIFYRAGLEDKVQEVKTVLGAKRVQTSVIDWDTFDDMIVIWGQPEAAELTASGVQGAPIVQGTRTKADDGNVIDDAVGGLGDTKDAIDGGIDTGKSIQDLAP